MIIQFDEQHVVSKHLVSESSNTAKRDFSSAPATPSLTLPPSAPPSTPQSAAATATSAAASNAGASPAVVTPMPGRPAGALPEAGIWECGIKDTTSRTNTYFKLQIVVAADHTMIVTSYANAPTTMMANDPLTFTAVNPRGSRLTTFTWKPNNTMTLDGPKLSDPASTFHNEGACTKI